MKHNQLSKFLADVVLTSHYLAEPLHKIDVEISDAEMRALKIIASFEPISMQQIAEKLHASKPRASQLVALLESHGMIIRTVASDRRRVDVKTSAKGKTSIEKLEVRYEALAQSITIKLGKKDADELTRLLALITPLSSLQNKNLD